MSDFVVENHGSICLLQPMTKEARAWIEDTKPEDAMMWGTALVVEPRYVEGVVEAATNSGYTVE